MPSLGRLYRDIIVRYLLEVSVWPANSQVSLQVNLAWAVLMFHIYALCHIGAMPQKAGIEGGTRTLTRPFGPLRNDEYALHLAEQVSVNLSQQSQPQVRQVLQNFAAPFEADLLDESPKDQQGEIMALCDCALRAPLAAQGTV